jgi:hypothetical protein
MSSPPPLPIVGEAVQVKERTETSFNTGRPKQIWTFRLQSAKDAEGNSVPATIVEMRGRKFTGALNEGEEVKVYGKWRDGILQSRRVFNQTTQSWFEVPALFRRLGRIGTIVVVALFVAAVVFAVVLVRRSMNSRPIDEPPAAATEVPAPPADPRPP